MDTIQTKDGKIYKIQIQLFRRYSKFYKEVINERTGQELDPIFLPTISSEEFDFVFEFLQLHKLNDPIPLGQLVPGKKLIEIMEEADAELIERIFEKSQSEIKSVLQAAFYLQIEDLKKRLSAGIVTNLNPEKIKQRQKKLGKEKINQVQISKQIQFRINGVLFRREQKQSQ